MPRRRKNDFLQGTLDLLVLRALRHGPRHGYAIMSWIEQASDDALRVEEGALYPALHRMEERGWLRGEWGLSDNNRHARFYRLTPTGTRQLDRQSASWTNHATAVSRVLLAES